jgi:hypothetical protein
MKHLLVLVTLVLAGCQTASIAPIRSPVVGAVVDIVPSKMLVYLKRACGFQTSLVVAERLLEAFGGIDVPDKINAIIAEVCPIIQAQVSPGTSSVGLFSASQPPVVRGVALRGRVVTP